MTDTRKKVTLRTLLSMKESKTPASFITAYDYPSAVFANESQIDMLLVGDSGGMTVLGYKNTMPVTMEEMLHFTKAVCRGNKYAFVVGDMPFMSYQSCDIDAVENAGKFMQSGCDAVKIEIQNITLLDRLSAIIAAGIPVMVHIGLTPQSMAIEGGYKVYGKLVSELGDLINLAECAQDEGASFILLEAMPERPAEIIKNKVKIPVYGIGAGPALDGQLLIWHDVLGLFAGDIKPKFAKQFANLKPAIKEALMNYNIQVKEGRFPSPEYCYQITPDELSKLEDAFK